MNFKNIIILLILFIVSGCSIFQSSKSEIQSFDQSYLKNKYVGKTGWAKEDLGGIKKGDSLKIEKIKFGVRTIVRLKSSYTDYYFIIYSNKNLVPKNKDKDKVKKVDYDLVKIENEIINKISFIKQ